MARKAAETNKPSRDQPLFKGLKLFFMRPALSLQLTRQRSLTEGAGSWPPDAKVGFHAQARTIWPSMGTIFKPGGFNHFSVLKTWYFSWHCERFSVFLRDFTMKPWGCHIQCPSIMLEALQQLMATLEKHARVVSDFLYGATHSQGRLGKHGKTINQHQPTSISWDGIGVLWGIVSSIRQDHEACSYVLGWYCFATGHEASKCVSILLEVPWCKDPASRESITHNTGKLFCQ